MTLDELLEAARSAVRWPEPGTEDLARGVIDVLGESQPCVIDNPFEVAKLKTGAREIRVSDEIVGAYSPAEARAIAAMLLRAADEAEAV